MQISKNFLWGVATAANQMEGGYLEGGRKLSNIDLLPYGEYRLPIAKSEVAYDEVPDGLYFPSHNGIDFYHHYKEDIALMAELGIKCFRFSISWSRIFPTGLEDKPNEEGLQFYGDIISELLKYGIEPLVTISHFDVPKELMDAFESWKSRKMIEAYEKYAVTLFKQFADKVKYWITFNEINMMLHKPFTAAGIYISPEENREKIIFQASHYELVASALVTKRLREIAPTAQMGCMLAAGEYYPYSCDPEDVRKAQKSNQENYFFVDVQARGEYPKWSLNKLENLEIDITSEDIELLKENTVDYISFSYYASRTAKENVEGVDTNTGNAAGGVVNPYLERSEWGWMIDPLGFEITIQSIWDRYQKPLFVVENGLGAQDILTDDKKIHDVYRINYLRWHISSMLNCMIGSHIPILGYTMWTAIDIVSASGGEMKKRYGLVYVDKDNLGNGSFKRYKKDSFAWYQELIRTNGESIL